MPTGGRSSMVTPSTSKQRADGSLKRLRIETIDLFFQHRVDPEVPIENVAGAVKELVEEGKVRHFGLSDLSSDPCTCSGNSVRDQVTPERQA